MLEKNIFPNKTPSKIIILLKEFRPLNYTPVDSNERLNVLYDAKEPLSGCPYFINGSKFNYPTKCPYDSCFYQFLNSFAGSL